LWVDKRLSHHSKTAIRRSFMYAVMLIAAYLQTQHPTIFKSNTILRRPC
jgi:hypothetical protein